MPLRNSGVFERREKKTEGGREPEGKGEKERGREEGKKAEGRKEKERRIELGACSSFAK